MPTASGNAVSGRCVCIQVSEPSSVCVQKISTLVLEEKHDDDEALLLNLAEVRASKRCGQSSLQ